MPIGPSSDPRVAAFFASSVPEKERQIDTALKEEQLDFIQEIINSAGDDKKILKSVLKGCIDCDRSSVLAIEVIRKKVFENTEEKKEAVFAATQKGEVAIVEELFKIGIDGIDLDLKDQEKAIEIAIKEAETILASSDIDRSSLNRLLNIITILLKKGPVSEQIQLSIVSLAIKANSIDLIGSLLERPLAEGLLGKAVVLAAKSGDLPIVQALLTDDEDLRCEAFIEAARGGHLSVVEALLAGDATISDEDRGYAVIEAAKGGHLEVIKRLLAGGAKISDKDRGYAVIEAVRAGHLEVIKRLLAGGATILNAHREQAFDEAVKFAYGSIVAALMANGLISAERQKFLFNWAARNGHLPVIERLLAVGATISDEDRGYAVIEAASFGHLEVIQALLAGGATISDEDREQAIKNAIRGGHASVIKRLVTDGAKISDQVTELALIYAAEKGHLGVIEALLAGGAVISDKNRGRAVIEAARFGHLAVIQALFRDGSTIAKEIRRQAFNLYMGIGAMSPIHRLTPIEKVAVMQTLIGADEELKTQGIVNAARNGDISIIEALLAGGATISDKDRGRAVVEAARFGHLAIIQALLAGGATISDKDRGEAVVDAIKGAHVSVIETLLARGATISKEMRRAALKLCMKIDTISPIYQLTPIEKVSIMQKLIGDDKELKALAVYFAAVGGQLSIIEALLARGATISDGDRGEAVIFAARGGHLSVIERLLAGGATISDGDRGEAVIFAARGGHLSVIERLLAGGARISDGDRGQAIKDAAEGGHLEVIERLLAGGSISQEERGQVVVNAAGGGHLSVIERLLSAGATISDEVRGQAVINAARGGHLEVIERLLAGGARISDEARGFAIKAARLDNHVSILTFFGVPLAATQMVDHHLYINRDKIKEDPALCLSLVSEGFSEVSFLNPDGIELPSIVDRAVLNKEFIHNLVDELVLKDIIKIDRKKFPLCDASSSEASYKNLGKLLSIIDQKNQGQVNGIDIGRLFDPNVFECFQDFLDPALSKKQRMKKLANHLKDDTTKHLVDFLNIDEPTEDDVTAFKAVLAQKHGDAFKDKTKEELKKMCEEPFEAYFKGISLIVSGFSDDLKRKILSMGVDYEEFLQGPEIKPSVLDKTTLAKIAVYSSGSSITLKTAQSIDVNEGFSRDTLTLFDSLLDEIGLDFAKKVPASMSEVQSDLVEGFKKTKKIVAHSLIISKEINKLLEADLEVQATKIAKDVMDKLSADETAILPLVFLSTSSSGVQEGHAISLEINKQSDGRFNITVYNTGFGIEHHKKIPGTSKYYPVVIKDIPSSAINIDQLKELLMKQGKYSPVGLEDQFKVFYTFIKSLGVQDDESARAYNQQGIIGNCTLKCITKIMHDKLGLDYEFIKTLMHQKLYNQLIASVGTSILTYDIKTSPDFSSFIKKLKDDYSVSDDDIEALVSDNVMSRANAYTKILGLLGGEKNLKLMLDQLNVAAEYMFGMRRSGSSDLITVQSLISYMKDFRPTGSEPAKDIYVLVVADILKKEIRNTSKKVDFSEYGEFAT